MRYKDGDSGDVSTHDAAKFEAVSAMGDDRMSKVEASPNWPRWAGLLVAVGCLVTIAATLNDIF